MKGCLKVFVVLVAIFLLIVLVTSVALLPRAAQVTESPPTATPTVVRLLPQQPTRQPTEPVQAAPIQPTATDTSVPLPTNTSVPLPTNTPLPPTNTPLPTETPIPLPTETPTPDYSPRPLPADFTPVAPPPAAPPAPAAIERSAPAIELPTLRPPPSADASTCDCSGDTLNCGDFNDTGWSAQACYMRCIQLTGKDIHQLDGDDDGTACEWSW